MLVYMVKNGDTLWQIAKEHQISLDALLAANPLISEPNYIMPGASINIPSLVRMRMESAEEMENPRERERENHRQREWEYQREQELEQETLQEREMLRERELARETTQRELSAAERQTIPEPAEPYCREGSARPCILVTRGGETLAAISAEWNIPLAQLHYHNYQYAKNTQLPGGERIIIPTAPEYRININHYPPPNAQRGRRRR